MSPRRVGFITIGQSPRTDIVGDIEPLLHGVEIVEAGALDGLAGDELHQIAPEAGEFVLASRLRDGSQVIMGKEKILPRLQRAVETVVDRGAEIVVVLCTGEFPQLTCSVPILFPDRILTHFVQAVMPAAGKLGVLVPLAEQRTWARQRWQTVCADLTVGSVSPYVGFDDGVSALGGMQHRDLVVMDCMGYSQRQKACVRERVKGPVVLPKTLVARTIQELVE